jgi:hypothetical protein
MKQILTAFKHLKTILIHKYWVAKYCFQLGLYWRGVTHDFSKFHPIEFLESIKYYTGTSSPINECKKDKGYSLAWQHHKGHNSHHYEYWIDLLDIGGEPIKMPKDDLKELICDWIGAGKTYMGSDFTFEKELKYVSSRINNAKMHKNTKDAIYRIFVLLSESDLDFNTIVNYVLICY